MGLKLHHVKALAKVGELGYLIKIGYPQLF